MPSVVWLGELTQILIKIFVEAISTMRYLNPAALLLLLVGSSVPVLSRSAIATDISPSTPEGANAENELNQPTNTVQPAVATNKSKLVALLDSAQGEVNRSLIQSVSFSPSQRSPLLLSQATVTTPTVLEGDAIQEPQFSQAAKPEPAATSENVESEGITIEIQAQAPKDNKLKDMEDFRQLVQGEQVQDVQVQAQASDAEDLPTEDLPTLEEEAPAEPAPVAPPAEPVDESEDDPTVEPTDEPVELNDTETDDDEAEPSDADVQPSSTAADLNAIPDVLLSDPNPLSFPTVPEEVDIERNPLVTLEEAIQLAYNNNQALQTSLLQLEQAESALDEQQAALLPTISTTAGLDSSQSASGINQTTIDGNIGIAYDVLTGGGRRASIRAAELQVDVSALAVEAQQEQLRLVTANLYYALQESIEQIRINQAFVDEADRNLRDSELRQEVGVGTRFDVLRAEVQLANAQQSLVQSQFNEDIARRDISRLLNLPPTAGLQTTSVEQAEDWPLDLEASILLAFQNRSELEQQLLQADISEEQRKIALAAVRPQVSLSAQYGFLSVIDTNTVQSTLQEGDIKDTFAIGLNFNWTLFNGGASRAAARQQEVSALIAEEQFSETLDQIRFDVEQAFFNIQANDANIATSNSAVVQAEAALELANLRLQAGVGTQLDVLTAQSELTQAQVNNVAAILGYNRALVAIQRAISNLEL